ncbi:MAG: tRNA adenosine(34) deaminase TadA [Clostridia bacterium]|jgi:tRNA(adenine34) deaminase|nr:tRNA adenosine(34) deaminase TadA [Clostridia bacterium]MCI1999833.1 tRNA adenosine(34) deaminase TadA [Clostridia bacterium]MCI2014251.1 tRNA adenosine(34) deaminase TadA [Clostridia bacterium]
MENDIFFMNEAIKEAYKALEINEVPIGAVIVHNGEIIGRGYNRRNSEKNPLYHAEIIAINEAAKAIGDWRIENCTIYVTIEPCPMCAGAIVQARIPRVVFGARNRKAGCCGSVVNILQQDGLNHRAEITEGVLKDKCSALMSEFFKRFRKQSE